MIKLRTSLFLRCQNILTLTVLSKKVGSFLQLDYNFKLAAYSQYF